MLPLIHLDMCNCLVRRQIPLYQLRPMERKPEGRTGVDRHIGLCVPLFSLLYDVCCVSQNIWKLSMYYSMDELAREETDRELLRLESAVRD